MRRAMGVRTCHSLQRKLAASSLFVESNAAPRSTVCDSSMVRCGVLVLPWFKSDCRESAVTRVISASPPTLWRSTSVNDDSGRAVNEAQFTL